MAVLFNNRKLAESFLHRHVVIMSEGHCDRNNQVRFGFEIDFGKHGKLGNRVTIAAAANDLRSFHKGLAAYQDEIYELIGALEELERWSQFSNPLTPFSHVLMQTKPLFLYASVAKEVLTFQIFGEGLYDFEIRWDLNRAGESSSLSRKLTEMRRALGDHLRDIDSIGVEEILVSKQEEVA